MGISLTKLISTLSPLTYEGEALCFVKVQKCSTFYVGRSHELPVFTALVKSFRTAL